MKRKVITLFAILTASILFYSVAQADSTGKLDELRARVKEYTLDNGLKIIFLRRGTAPVFSGAVVARVGGVDENRGHTGISHMLEHMAFKGTPTIGTKNYKLEKTLLKRREELELRKQAGDDVSVELKDLDEQLGELWELGALTAELERRGAHGLNATTDKELTKYFESLPKSSFEFWAWLESERILNPVMRQFYRERDVVLEEWRMRYVNDPEGEMYLTLLSTVYSGHPYGDPVIGYPFDLRKLTATQVEAFQRKYYTPSNLVVALVGDVDPERDIEIVRKYFGRIPAGKAPKLPDIPQAKQKGERRFVLQANASPQLLIAYRKPNYPHKDDPPISVMLEILGSGRISPLYKEMVERKRVASQVSHFEAPGLAYPNLMCFHVSARHPHTTEELEQTFDQVLRKFIKDGVKEEDLRRAKRQIAMDYLVSLRSSLSLARELAGIELLYGKWEAMLDWYDEVMEVTTEDIERVARQYLKKDQRTVGIIETKRG